MKTWQLAASHTHLYPGARLQCVPASATRPRWQAGEAVLLEFSDGVAVPGELHCIEPAGVQLRLAAYCTAKGSAIAAKAWQLQWLGEAAPSAQLRVQARAA